MRRIVSALLLSITFTLAGATTANAYMGMSYANAYRMTLRIHNCEEPTWHVKGKYYRGGLGWRPATWLTFRLPWMPTTMDMATVREQVIAMQRFAKRYGWPDQLGCHKGGY